MFSSVELKGAVALLGLVAACAGAGCDEGLGTVPNGAGNVPATGGTTAGEGASGAGTAGTAGTAGACPVGPSGFTVEAGGTSCGTPGLPASFTWMSSGPLISPIPDATHDIVSVKDPTVVFFNDRWHVYATTANSGGSWNMVYLNFADWSQAASAPQYYLDNNPLLRGYHCAPELFYFTPQQKWYLVYQSGPPQYSTADDPTKPETWTLPKSFFASEPAIVTANKGTGTWLDFWVICDATSCYLFFSDDNGHWYRSQTAIGDFPNGFSDPVMALQDTKENLFEASNVYKLKGTDQYLAIVEAFGPTGRRYFRSFAATSLDGEWTPLLDTWATPFAGQNNVSFDVCAPGWTQDISHGELLRDGYDETLTVDPCNLRFLYQGVATSKRNNSNYSQIPWQIGVLAPTN
jgi:hypothetical protein